VRDGVLHKKDKLNKTSGGIIGFFLSKKDSLGFEIQLAEAFHLFTIWGWQAGWGQVACRRHSSGLGIDTGAFYVRLRRVTLLQRRNGMSLGNLPHFIPAKIVTRFL
jgi:hypothetical protein